MADFGDVAGMEEDVGFGEGKAVRMGGVGGRKGRGGMGIGENDKAGADGLGRHDGGF